MRKHEVECVIENIEEGPALAAVANAFWRDAIENGLKQSELSDEEKLSALNQIIDNLYCHMGKNLL